MDLVGAVKKFVTGEDGESSGAEGPANGDGEVCAACSRPGAEKKWAGQWWHKKCYRRMRRVARGML